ncbi:MAG TPA: hypothetical protein VMO26_27515 [Vicinamibacterales bacterium]|nr:hypothetical protein [Vicinamibacterales bacterium]
MPPQYRLSGGKPLELLELARAGQIELGVSDAILDETGRVLKDKFHVPEDVRDLRQELLGFAKHVTPAEVLEAVPATWPTIEFSSAQLRLVQGRS